MCARFPWQRIVKHNLQNETQTARVKLNSSKMSCSARNLDPAAATEVNLENTFVAMAKSGDPKADGRSMNQQTLEKWFKDANVVDGTISMADVTGSFSKVGKPAISYAEFTKMLADLATSKKVDLNALKGKLAKSSC